MIVTGGSTSNCIRATVFDAVVVQLPHDRRAGRRCSTAFRSRTRSRCSTWTGSSPTSFRRRTSSRYLGGLAGQRRIRLMRSKLFVPASRPELVREGDGERRRRVSFDLEDAVEARQKARRARGAGRVSENVCSGTMGSSSSFVSMPPIPTPYFETISSAVVGAGRRCHQPADGRERGDRPQRCRANRAPRGRAGP